MKTLGKVVYLGVLRGVRYRERRGERVFPDSKVGQKNTGLTFNKELFQVALTLIPGIGPVRGQKLLEHFGSVEGLFRAPEKELKGLRKIGNILAKELFEPKWLRLAEDVLMECKREGIRVLLKGDEGYPDLLENIHASPLVLYVKGDLDLNETINVSVVGTRTPSNYGKEVAKYFSEHLASRGVNVVSGLAYGIDMTAHRGAMNAGGKTTAVLAHGHKYIYPDHHWREAGQIAENGALVSDFHFFQKPESGNFPSRNRLISGLSHAVLVVEAAQKGGALITANFGFEQDRGIYAIPGNIQRKKSFGCNDLIRRNVAKLVGHPDEILDDLEAMLGVQFVEAQKGHLGEEVELMPEEEDIVVFLQEGEKQIEDLLSLSEFPVSQLQSVLLNLELKGVIKQRPGRVFSLSERFC